MVTSVDIIVLIGRPITNVDLSGTGRNVDECSHHRSDR